MERIWNLKNHHFATLNEIIDQSKYLQWIKPRMMVDGELYNGGIKLSSPDILMNLSITKRGTATHYVLPVVIQSEGLLPNKNIEHDANQKSRANFHLIGNTWKNRLNDITRK